MPCHEHGVELDGFHEDNIEEDAFAGPAAEIRERRASPSGDSEETKVFDMVKKYKNEKNKREEVTRAMEKKNPLNGG